MTPIYIVCIYIKFYGWLGKLCSKRAMSYRFGYHLIGMVIKNQVIIYHPFIIKKVQNIQNNLRGFESTIFCF